VRLQRDHAKPHTSLTSHPTPIVDFLTRSPLPLKKKPSARAKGSPKDCLSCFP
jgi:hypothetical protein